MQTEEQTTGNRRETRYKKSDAVKDLERMADAEARRRHPTMPYLAPRKFRDDSANSLTTCIVKYIELRGGFASRVSNQGTFSRKLNKYIPSTAKRGLPDIIATYQGLSLHVEVKAGRDRQSEHQKAVEFAVNGAGGRYFVAHNFTEFKQWIDKL